MTLPLTERELTAKPDALCREVRATRHALGITQAQLGKMAGCSREAIKRLERGYLLRHEAKAKRYLELMHACVAANQHREVA